MANNTSKQGKGDFKSLRTTTLMLQLESYKEVVKRAQDAVYKEQAIFDQQMLEVWRKSLEFIENANAHHDSKGISSPWWNAQLLRIQNPVIYQESSAKRQRKNELEKLLVVIKDTELNVRNKEIDISKLKDKMTNETARILDLKKIETELHQEPFGFEFNCLKAKVESSKQACLQLSWSTGGGPMSHPQECSSFRFQPKEPRLKELVISPQKKPGESADRKTTKRSKYFKIRERTTYLYQSEPLNSYNTMDCIENEMLPQRDYDNSEEREGEITHS